MTGIEIVSYPSVLDGKITDDFLQLQFGYKHLPLLLKFFATANVVGNRVRVIERTPNADVAKLKRLFLSFNSKVTLFNESIDDQSLAFLSFVALFSSSETHFFINSQKSKKLSCALQSFGGSTSVSDFFIKIHPTENIGGTVSTDNLNISLAALAISSVAKTTSKIIFFGNKEKTLFLKKLSDTINSLGGKTVYSLLK